MKAKLDVLIESMKILSLGMLQNLISLLDTFMFCEGPRTAGGALQRRGVIRGLFRVFLVI